MDWWFILFVVLAIILVSKFISFRHTKYRVMAILGILLVAFLIMTFIAVVNANSINLKTASGITQAGKVYVAWFGQVFINIKTIAGNAVHLDWFPRGSNISDLNPKNFMRG